MHHLQRCVSDQDCVLLLLLVNETFGDPLLPGLIDCGDYQQLVDSIGNDETTLNLLCKWYGPLRTKHAASYYALQVNSQEHAAQWADDEKELRALFTKYLPAELRDIYLLSYAEHLAKWLASASPPLPKHCVWLSRKFLSSQPPPKLNEIRTMLRNVIDEDKILRLQLRTQDDSGSLNPDLCPEHAQYLDDFAAQLYPALLSLADGLINQNDLPWTGLSRSLLQDLTSQCAHAQELLKASHPWPAHDNVIEQIRDYFSKDPSPSPPVLLMGDEGSGKSSVTARLIVALKEWLPDVNVIFRFIGHSSILEANEHRLLKSLMEQCCLILGEPLTYPLQTSYEHLPVLLQRVSPVQPIVIILDRFDALELADGSGTKLSWLPQSLPDNLHVIITVQSSSKHLEMLKTEISGTVPVFSINPPHPDDCTALIKSVVETEVQPAYLSALESYSCSCNSVSTCIQLALCTSCDHLHSPEKPSFAFHSNVNQLNVDTIVQLANSALFVPFTAILRILLYLSLTKSGLTFSELHNILSKDSEFIGAAFPNLEDPSHLPVYFLWQCINSLTPFILFVHRQTGLIQVRHKGMCRTLRVQYVDSSEHETLVQSVCRQLSDYFLSKRSAGVAARTVDELPYLASLRKEQLVDQYVLNADFLYSKLCVSDISSVLDDVQLVLKQTQDAQVIEELKLFKEFLHLSSSALVYDGHQFFAQLYTRLTEFIASVGDQYPHILSLYQKANRPPAPSLLPLECCLQALSLDSLAVQPSLSPRSPSAVLSDIHREEFYTSLHRVRDCQRYVASLSILRNEVCIWDLYTQTRVRRISGIVQPRDVKFIDSRRALILCNRELKLYDLEECRFLSKLKGVMNQKMAYYGLHDDDHVVALARNRMYVNMINMTSGDCVATFKVGEDRFLNSLLVSANGRICVCGDETQKPFPLLVWDLNNRKLLYDLRIPHHDFVTNLSAITNDGHYVVCVCREVNDPTPNFIIVYDLQNGTLFKKWKPNISTCSVAISSEGGCVLTGLVNTQIIVWDLITGALRFSLRGHSAPVTYLRLCANGARCLSADMKARDRSLRLWDLVSGACLASFTPDVPITCCELSASGDAILVGLLGQPNLVSLLLCNERTIKETQDSIPPEDYGNIENKGKEADVTNDG